MNRNRVMYPTVQASGGHGGYEYKPVCVPMVYALLKCVYLIDGGHESGHPEVEPRLVGGTGEDGTDEAECERVELRRERVLGTCGRDGGDGGGGGGGGGARRCEEVRGKKREVSTVRVHKQMLFVCSSPQRVLIRATVHTSHVVSIITVRLRCPPSLYSLYIQHRPTYRAGS